MTSLDSLVRQSSAFRNLSLIGIMASALFTSGCVRHGYCAKPQDYEKAESIPAIAGTDGLVVKTAPNAFIIPPPPATPVPFGLKVNDPERPGSEMWSCLDQPPAFTPTAPVKSTQ